MDVSNENHNNICAISGLHRYRVILLAGMMMLVGGAGPDDVTRARHEAAQPDAALSADAQHDLGTGMRHATVASALTLAQALPATKNAVPPQKAVVACTPSPTTPICAPPNPRIPDPTCSPVCVYPTGTFQPAVPYTNPAQSTVWSTNKVQIMVSVNGATATRFVAKGINYEPTQIGGSADYGPFNDFFYDTSVSGVHGGTWNGLWKRDYPIMQALGVNSLRTYGWWKWEPAFWNGDRNFANYAKLDFTLNNTQGGFPDPNTPSILTYPHDSHETFLDLCWNNGVNPTYVWIGLSINAGAQFLNPAGDEEAARQFMKWTALWAATKYGNHPAVIGFVIGNEQNQNPAASPPPNGTTQTAEFWGYMNVLNAIIKAVAPTKLTMSVFTDDPNVWTAPIIYATGEGTAQPPAYDKFYVTLFQKYYKNKKPPQIYQQDVWGLNPYTNPTLGGGILARYYADIVKLDPTNDSYVKPLLFTEWGVPTSTHTYDGTDAYPGCWWVNVWVSKPPCTNNPITSPPGSPGPQPAVGTPPNTTSLPSTYTDAARAVHTYTVPAALTKLFPNAPTTPLPSAQSAWWLEQFWQTTVANIADNRDLGIPSSTKWTSGGYVFEWIDEWWKNGNPTQKDGAVPTGFNSVFPGGWDDEEYFGLMVGALSGRTCSLTTCPVVNTNTGGLEGNPDTLSPMATLIAIYNQYTKPIHLGTSRAKIGAGSASPSIVGKPPP